MDKLEKALENILQEAEEKFTYRDAIGYYERNMVRGLRAEYVFKELRREVRFNPKILDGIIPLP